MSGYRMLLKKSLSEAILLGLPLCVLMFIVPSIYLFFASELNLGVFENFLNMLPDSFKSLSTVPVTELAKPKGIVSMLFVHPLVTMSIFAWAISRGSAVVSGEIGRGTMESLLALPVRRIAIVLFPTFVMIIGSIMIGIFLYLGLFVGLKICHFQQPPPVSFFVPACILASSLSFCLCGISTMVSSLDRYRWRTVGFMGAFIIVQILMQLLGMWSSNLESWEGMFHWMEVCSVFYYYDPQTVLLTSDDSVWSIGLQGSMTLCIFGVIGFAIGIARFCYRDIPAPL